MTFSAVILSLGLLLPGPVPDQQPRPDAVGPRSATWPLEPNPPVVTGFAPPSAVWGVGHRGVDLLGAPGQSVLAAAAGTVSFAGTIAGRGVVVVDAGTRRTTYEPVHARVRTGEPVAIGAVIGTLQTGPSHCAPRTCLHWGLLEGRGYLDPLSMLGLGPVRLLPD